MEETEEQPIPGLGEVDQVIPVPGFLVEEQEHQLSGATTMEEGEGEPVVPEDENLRGLSDMGERLHQFAGMFTSTVQNTAVVNDEHYLYTRSPSSGTGSEEEQDDSECDESQGFQQAPAAGFAMEVENSKDTMMGSSDTKITDTVEAANQNLDMNTQRNLESPETAKQEKEEQDSDAQMEQESSVKKESEKYDPFEEYEGSEDNNGYGTEYFKIFVSNLPPGLQNSELKELFEKYGDVEACEIFAKNYAFVHMASEASGYHAMEELNGLDMRGCKINVKRSVQTSGTKGGKPVLPANAVKGASLEVGTFKIFIGNLFEDITKEDVEKLIEESECGRVVEVEIFRNNQAFVHMETEEGGRMAIEKLNGKLLPDPETERLLRVTVSNNPRRPSLATMKLKVKNVSLSATAAELRTLFQPYGLVLGVKIHPRIHPVSGGTRQAVVLLEQYGNIRSAIKELTGHELNGIKLVVEACFDKEEEPTPPQHRHNNRSMFNQGGYDDWHDSSFQPARPPPPRGFGPSPRMRLIPMPSQDEIRRCPRGNRGRVLFGRPPVLMQQQFGGPNHLFPAGGYSGDEYGFSEPINDGFNNYIPPMKRSHVDWDNGGGNTNFQRPFGNRGNGQQQRQEPFPDFPPTEAFPDAGRPPSLMSVPIQNSTEDCDWSDDLPLSTFSTFSTGVQDFTSDGPAATTHAVPFDYSQINNRLANRHGPGKRSGNKVRMQKVMKGNSKSKMRRPGLGTEQQLKKFANQSGNIKEAGEEGPVATSAATSQPYQTATSATGGNGNNAASSSSAYAPYYFQQNWSVTSKRQSYKPSAKQMKEAEEEQKRQYSDYLKQKPWLYQAIPGTVKRVDK